MSTAPIPTTFAPVNNVPLDQIEVVATENDRLEMDEGAIKELASSMAASGQIQRIVCTANPAGAAKPYRLHIGYRRYAAAQRLKWTGINIDIAPETVSVKRLAIMRQQENIQREGLTPYELARSCARLAKEYKMSTKEIVAETGKANSHVNNLIFIWDNLAPKIAEQWKAGHANATFDYLRKVSAIRGRDEKPDHEAQWAEWASKAAPAAGGAATGAAGGGGNGGGGTGPARKARGTGTRTIVAHVEFLDKFFKSDAANNVPVEPRMYVRALLQFIVGRRKMPPEGIALPEKAAQKRGKAVKKGTKKSRKGAK